MKQIIIYTSQFSKFSELVKEFLQEKNVEFKEKDVKVTENLKELEDLSGQSAVPVIRIGEEIIFGFNKEKIEKAISE